MSLNPGDRVYTLGEEISVTNTSGSDLGRGEWATITADHEVAPADSVEGGLDVVIDYPIPAGESGKAHFGGGVMARIATDVDSGDHLVEADTSATSPSEASGVAQEGGDASDPVVLGDPISTDGDYAYALVHF